MRSLKLLDVLPLLVEVSAQILSTVPTFTGIDFWTYALCNRFFSRQKWHWMYFCYICPFESWLHEIDKVYYEPWLRDVTTVEQFPVISRAKNTKKLLLNWNVTLFKCNQLVLFSDGIGKSMDNYNTKQIVFSQKGWCFGNTRASKEETMRVNDK